MRRGGGLEAQLDAFHHQLRRTRRAWIAKCHPEVLVLDGGGLVFTGKGPPDYLGVIDGGSVVFDAKETSTKRWPYSKLKKHQAMDLEAASLQGCVAFLVVRYVKERRVFVLPWSELRDWWWRWHDEGGKPASISIDDERLHELAGVNWTAVLPSMQEAKCGKTAQEEAPSDTQGSPS